MTPWPYVVVAAAVLFSLVLVLRTVPLEGWRCGALVRTRRPRVPLRSSRSSLPELAAPRAAALSEAGDSAAQAGKLAAAVGFYLRAMRVDPRAVSPIRNIATVLARHPRRLERLLLRRLAQGPWKGEAAAAAAEAARCLAESYRRTPAKRSLAAVMERLAGELRSETGAASSVLLSIRRRFTAGHHQGTQVEGHA